MRINFMFKKQEQKEIYNYETNKNITIKKTKFRFCYLQSTVILEIKLFKYFYITQGCEVLER